MGGYVAAPCGIEGDGVSDLGGKVAVDQVGEPFFFGALVAEFVLIQLVGGLAVLTLDVAQIEACAVGEDNGQLARPVDIDTADANAVLAALANHAAKIDAVAVGVGEYQLALVVDLGLGDADTVLTLDIAKVEDRTVGKGYRQLACVGEADARKTYAVLAVLARDTTQIHGFSRGKAKDQLACLVDASHIHGRGVTLSALVYLTETDVLVVTQAIRHIFLLVHGNTCHSGGIRGGGV